MHTVYVVGNALLENDSLPLRLLPKLRKALPELRFEELDPSEDFPEERELTIIDTVQEAEEAGRHPAAGPPRVRTLTELDRIVSAKPTSLHDFDLGLTLKLLKKAGRLDAVRIVCVPMGMPEDEAFAGVKKELARLCAQR